MNISKIHQHPKLFPSKKPTLTGEDFSTTRVHYIAPPKQVHLSGAASFLEINKSSYKNCPRPIRVISLPMLYIRQWRRSGVFIVNFEHISHLVLVFLLLLTLNM